MANYNLNLASTYCQHWGLWEAIREILQNGEDQFTLDPSNQITVNYNEKSQKLVISNKESVLERKTLLLGIKSKADNDKLIGNFGEGYKIALLILTKLNKKAVIKNFKKNEKWTPELKKDSKYDNEKVLKVNIKKYLFKGDRDNNLTWEINGITPKEWASVSSKYLRYQDLGSVFTTTKGAQILFEKRYQGCVYVNGLFIEKVKSKMAYGYNLTPASIKLDRDRGTVEGTDLFFETMYLLSEYATTHPEIVSELRDKIESENSYEDFKYLLESQIFMNDEMITNFSESFKETFELENKTPSFPVSNEKEKIEVLAYYPTATTSIVSKKAKSMLSKTPVYKNINTFMAVHGGLQEKKTLEPSEIMKMFMDQHMSKVYDSEIVEGFKKLIEESENWQNKPKETLEKKITKDFDSIKEVSELPVIPDKINKMEIIGNVEFDDDVPF